MEEQQNHYSAMVNFNMVKILESGNKDKGNVYIGSKEGAKDYIQ